MSKQHRQAEDQKTDIAGEAAEALRKADPEGAMAWVARLLSAAIAQGEQPETLRALCHALERALMRARLTMSDGNSRGWTHVRWELGRVKPAATALLGAYIVMDTARAIEMMEDIEAVLAAAGSWREDYDLYRGRDRDEPTVEAVALMQLLSLGHVPKVMAYLEARLSGAREAGDESLHAVQSAIQEMLIQYLKNGEYEQAHAVVRRIGKLRPPLLAALPPSVFDPHWAMIANKDVGFALQLMNALPREARGTGEPTLTSVLVEHARRGDIDHLKEAMDTLGDRFVWSLFQMRIGAKEYGGTEDLIATMGQPLQYRALVDLYDATGNLDSLEATFSRWREFETRLAKGDLDSAELEATYKRWHEFETGWRNDESYAAFKKEENQRKRFMSGETGCAARLSEILATMRGARQRQEFERLMARGEARGMVSPSELASHYSQLASWDLEDKNVKAAVGNWRKSCTLAEGALSASGRSLGKDIATAFLADGDVKSGLEIASSVMGRDKEYLEFLLSHAREAVRAGSEKNAVILAEAAEDLARALEDFATLTTIGNFYIRMGQSARGRAAQADAKKLDEEAERKIEEEEEEERRRRWDDDDD